MKTNYKKITSEDIDFFNSIIENDRIFFGDNINMDYSHDELGGIQKMPDVVIKVLSTEEVSKILKYCNDNLIPVLARGTGSGLVGAAVPIYGGVVLDTTLMNKILKLDKENLSITVQPGVLLQELAQFAEDNDYLYPPDPGEKTATIGGNISTNAGGMRAVKYGVTRDFIRALTVVMPNGDILKLGGNVVKNSSGYDLKDLIIGSEGTLAIITEAVVKIVHKPKVSISLLVPFKNINDGIGCVPKIVTHSDNIVAIEFMQRNVILHSEKYLGKKFPDSSSESYILLTFNGNSKTNVEQDYEEIANLCIENGAIDAYIVDTEERNESVWTARSAFLEAIKSSTDLMDECDVVVPRSNVAIFINYCKEVEKQTGIRIPCFGHAGDGNLHLYLCKDNLDEKIWEERCSNAFNLLYEKSIELGGFPSGEHGIGYVKKPYLLNQLGKKQINIMKAIKQVFDPNFILNPDKIFTI